MSGDYLPLLLFLIFVAAFLRDDFAFTLVYLLVGVFLVGSWWSPGRKLVEPQVHYWNYIQTAFFQSGFLRGKDPSRVGNQQH